MMEKDGDKSASKVSDSWVLHGFERVSPEDADTWLDPENFIYKGSIYYITPDVRIIRIGSADAL
jgi:hypothetical protein